MASGWPIYVSFPDGSGEVRDRVGSTPLPGELLEDGWVVDDVHINERDIAGQHVFFDIVVKRPDSDDALPA